MRVRHLLFLFLVLSLTACSSKTAFEYNQYMAQLEQSLMPDITRTEQLVAQYANARQFDSIAVVGDRMQTIVEEKLAAFKEKPAPKVKEGQNVKEAFIRYFDYVSSVYANYKNFGLQQTDEGRQLESQKLEKLMTRHDAILRDLQSAQRAYASANNFKLSNTPQ